MRLACVCSKLYLVSFSSIALVETITESGPPPPELLMNISAAVFFFCDRGIGGHQSAIDVTLNEGGEDSLPTSIHST
jgi:hypothetical protein